MTATLEPNTDLLTDPDDVAQAIARTRSSFARGTTKPLAWRYEQLDAMRALLEENEEALIDALRVDLGKSPIESFATDIGFVLNDLAHLRRRLKAWTKTRRVRVQAALLPGRAMIRSEPKGTVLIIGPWNYPVQLILVPLAAAIAAGNSVVVKPSELSPATSALLTELAERYLDNESIAFVNGGVPVATELLREPWDHIFFTGSTEVGRIVMRAAAEHLTPVTLELGGKSPTIVAADADIEVAAKRIAWGKCLNAGQTCIAPDYVLVERSRHDELVERLGEAIEAFYGVDASTSPDYGRIINDGHFDRLVGLLDGEAAGSTAVGGTIDRAERFIAPTVLTGTASEAAVMQEEIFGPVLPVLAVDSIEDAITFVTDRPKPLALYVFAKAKATIDAVLDRTSSGGVGINNTLLHVAPSDLPFGGVGPSGMGAYHGKAGFDAFSHAKPIYARPTWLDPDIAYPPYTDLKAKILRKI